MYVRNLTIEELREIEQIIEAQFAPPCGPWCVEWDVCAKKKEGDGCSAL